MSSQLVLACLERLELHAPDSVVDKMGEYCNEVLSWSRRIDLSGARTAEDFVDGPLFDALTLVPLLGHQGTLLDVGSGGGLPGVPTALLRPDLQITLLEPRTRRAAFLRHICAKLQLPCTVREGRLEDLGNTTFDSAVAQAVWPPSEWLRRAASVVRRPGGLVYVMTSAPLPPECLPSASQLDEQRHFKGRHVERWCARVRLQ